MRLLFWQEESVAGSGAHKQRSPIGWIRLEKPEIKEPEPRFVKSRLEQTEEIAVLSRSKLEEKSKLTVKDKTLLDIEDSLEVVSLAEIIELLELTALPDLIDLVEVCKVTEISKGIKQ